MPCGVENLPVEVEAVGGNFVFLLLARRVDLSGFQHGFHEASFSGGFQSHLFSGVDVENSEEIIVRPRHYRAIVSVPTTFEFIKYAVVFVQSAQFALQVFVYLESFDGLGLHVEVPYLAGQVVPSGHVAPRVAEFHVGYRRDDLREEGPLGWVFRLLEYCEED